MKGDTKDNVNFMNTTENKLTHFDAEGNAVMVDVSGKPVTSREATAHGIITMNEDAFAAVQNGTVKKGDVLGVARVAGIMATKRTSELIPLCCRSAGRWRPAAPSRPAASPAWRWRP